MNSNFRDWTLEKVERLIGTKQVRHLLVLDEWLAYEHTVDAFEQQCLTSLREGYLLGGDDWNEVELENKFISPLFVFAKIDNERFSYFLERELSATINGQIVSGKVDGLIASGFRSPREPYFCLNEYKRGTDPNGDPRGQVLIAMLAAQQANDNENPIFGCFIVGKVWSFVVLVGNEYAISTAYTCDGNEVFDIFRIVKGLRHMIDQLTL